MFPLYFFTPLADNHGKTFAQNDHEQFEAVLLELFGGLSLLTGTVAGQWLGKGKLYRDDLRVYMVAIKSIADGVKVTEAVEIAKRLYRQKKITICYLDQIEIL